MTTSQARFIGAVEAYEAEKERAKQAREALDAAIAELMANDNLAGLPGPFQDVNGVVYRLTVPSGTYVEFRRLDYQRTRKPGEKKGSLSLKEARELGFVLNEEGGS